MRILHIVPTYLPATRYGGPIYSVHSLCAALARRGHAVEVYTTNVDGAGESAVPLDQPLDLDGVQVRYFPSTWLRRLYWSPAMARRLALTIGGFDLLHLHSVFLWPTALGGRLARRAGVPYVLSPRGMLIAELIQRRGALRKRAWITWVERRNLAGAAALHFTAEAEREAYRQLRLPAREALVIPNGVEWPHPYQAEQLSPEVRALVGEGGYLLLLGRMSWKKGIERLIDAVALLPGERAVVVGNDEEGLLPALRAQVARLGLAERVAFLPRSVEGADKEALFAHAALFVLPSYSENFGNVVLEAMLRGCPVVVSAEVGAAEVVTASGGGLVVAGDAASLAAAIRQLEPRSVAEAMGSAGRAYVERYYGWDRVAEQMEAGYRRLLSPSGVE